MNAQLPMYSLYSSSWNEQIYGKFGKFSESDLEHEQASQKKVTEC